MAKKYFDRAAGFLIIILSLTVVIINLYSIFNPATSIPAIPISYGLLLAVFALSSIKHILNKNKYGYLMLVFTFLMLIIGLVKFI